MKTLRYAKRLIGFESTSHLSNRTIAKYLEMKLTKHGFVVEKLEYRDANRVRKVNLVAKKGTGTGGLGYFAHMDTVPADNWFSKRFGPYEPAIAKQRLYGRGSCDMKGSIACMLSACQLIPDEELKQPLYVVLTADEEAGYHGAKCVVEESKTYREIVRGGTKSVIGEPTFLDVVHAHKGSIHIRAVAKGKAAHSSMSDGVNANLAMIPFLVELKKIHDETQSDNVWQNAEFDPPTLSCNIGINDHNPALNITSPKSVATMSMRPMPGVDTEPLISRIQKAAEVYKLQLEIDRSAVPLYVERDNKFLNDCMQIVHAKKPKTVTYGTDAGVFTELEDVVVLGPGSIAQAHTVDEWISIEQLSLGTEVYAKMIRKWCCEEGNAT